MQIRLAESPADVALVRELWREYWESIALPMDFQGFGEELAGLPGVYGSEGGALLLATYNDEPAGTIAMRPLDRASGEVKRLYVRWQARGRGCARSLVEAVTERAVAMQYQCLYCDTLPSMMEALKLYESLGFERVEAFSKTPTPGAIYLKRILVVGAR